MPKSQAIHVSIPVLDMHTAVRFYTQVFGLEVCSYTEDLTQLKLGGHRISLRRVNAGSVSLQPGAANGVRSRHFGFEVAEPGDVDKGVKEVVECGGKVTLGPSDREDGRAAFCLDPSGNQVEIYSVIR